MSREHDFDKRFANPNTRPLDNLRSDEAREKVVKLGIVPARRYLAVEAVRNALRFAAKISRKVTGRPRTKPFPPRDFRL